MVFFKAIGKYLNQASENYGNFIVVGDFNINIRQASPGSHKIDEFLSLFSLTILIKSNTCFTNSLTIELFLINKPNFFQKTNAIKTGFSDHYKLICTFFKSCYNHAPLKKKFMRRNQAHFMTINLRKEVYTRNRLGNKFCKTLLRKMKNYTKSKETYVLPLKWNA